METLKTESLKGGEGGEKSTHTNPHTLALGEWSWGRGMKEPINFLMHLSHCLISFNGCTTLGINNYINEMKKETNKPHLQYFN